jgi:hypothetical protein
VVSLRRSFRSLAIRIRSGSCGPEFIGEAIP